MTAGRCHTLLSPVTEESGEEGTNSEISSPPACRSPSPVANTDASVNQDIAYYQALSAEQLALSAEQLQTEAAKIQPSASATQEFYEPGLESAASAKLDDLQRSWETLKNVISEKQRTLYEALERQQRYQDTLQSISTKMETIEVKLNESLEPAKSPESQMAEHQALMDEILMLQEEITELQTSLAQELVSEPLDAEAADQLALQSTLMVLAERMATIRMKASGKRQLLEEKLNEQLEEQRQEQALQRYRCEADELDHWLLNTRATLDTTLVTTEEPMDMEAQLVDCQNMLVEIEQKVVALSELSVHNENLLMEGKAHTKDEAEQLAVKLRTLKGSLLELQRVLHDKQINIRELEQELEEQKKLLRSVASLGEEILTQHGAPEGLSEKPDTLSEELGLEGEKPSSEEQMKMKWESLNQEFNTKQRLLQKALEQEQLVILQAEEGLKELDTGINELKKHVDKLQIDQPSMQELSKIQDMYDELMMIIGSRRNDLNQNLALKRQYERALQDLADLLETGQEKMAGDQKMIVASKEEVRSLLEKHKTWMRLDEDYQELTRQLESVEGSIPIVGLVEETEDRLTDRITLFQHLRSNLTEYQPKLYQVLDDGKRLLFSVSCSDLESQLNQLGERWLSNSSKVTKELHRLETILKHWTRYQSESSELTHWLQSAKERLQFWSQQSLTVPQELETVRDHLNSFLEFSKEVDAKSSQKSSVLSTGNQLLRLKKVDTAALRAGLSHIDSQWTELLTQIPAVQEKLHQGFKIDLSCKQLTVDFVNQSVLQISSQDVESKRSDKTDFAEQLGAMNRRWQILQGLITEKIQLLESLQESWAEYESNVQGLKTWFETQEKKLKQQQKIGDQASVQNALKDCQELEELIRTKEKEVENVEQSGLSLIQNKKEEVSSAVMKTLQEINHSWANLDHMISQLKILLQSVLDQWSIYKVAYEELNSYLTEARYSLSRFYLLTGSLEAVKVQVDSLQSLQDELEKQENSLQKFGSVTNQLLKECHPPVTETLTNTLKEVNMRWNNLLQEIAERLRASKGLLQLWQRYKDCYQQCSSTLRQREDQTNELLKTATSKDIADDEVTTWIRDCNDVLTDFKTAQESLVVLQELGEELKSQVEASAAAAIQSEHLSLKQNLSTLEQALRKQQAVLQAGVLDYQTFAKNLQVLEAWITEAEEILKGQDPSHSSDLSAIQSRMEELKGQMLKFSSMSPDLDRLNELGYRLPLNDKEIKRMQNLNRHWSLISSQTTERFRDEFNLKLTLLSNQWQGVIRRAQQRRGIIDSQIHQWQRYRDMAEKLRKWLVEISCQPVSGLGNVPIPLQQARALLDEVQLKEKVLLRQQGSYILTVEAGKQLLLSADSGAEAALQAELTEIQERWKTASTQLEQQKKQLALLLKDWEKCEKGIGDSLEKLRSFKKNLSQPLPEHHDELHAEQIRCKELENAVEGWTDDLAHLSLLKETLSVYISADDISILSERIELLHRQWEELCHQVSLRRQQVSERLNEWAVFSEKNKELCEWLTQMESKVSQNGDILIEEMIEKLKKDYQEEIAVAQKNKIQLQQMGERLAKASHESKASEIEYKLGKINDRWQHLLDLIAARVKKLKETLVAVQQLDKNMSSLRSWLAHIESELSKPIVYETCNSEEIQRKLNEQQELQRDIEKHSTGVASVLNLCEVLLHDCDACATEAECDSIQQATRNLDRRWRNICAMSMERRLKIEETWRLWQKFLDDYSRFEDWLKISERTAAFPSSSGVLYTVAKEELKKFEAFQRQVHESLTQLELINKQYRRLARENRTDSDCSLKQMVHEGNQRWDNLQKRVTSILRRLKHFIGQREEFETARDSILVWLTEMDLQLTNIEHFSECDVQAKIKQLKAFQQEISLNNNKIEQIIVQGEQLIEKSEPMDAAVIEEELDELRRYCQEVFGRVERYHKKLIRLPLTDDEHDLSDREVDLDESADLSDIHWHDKSADSILSPHPSSNLSLPLSQPVRSERSGRDTPASVDSIPLEWDHDYDLSRDLETAVSRALHSEEEDGQEKDFYLRGAAGIADVEIPETLEAYVTLTENALKNISGEPGALEAHIRQLDKALDTSRFQIQQTENVIRSKTPTGPELDSSYKGYVRGFCFSDLLKCVIDRWELIQAQALSKELRMKQNLQQWQQFNSDLNSIWAWLGETEEELERIRRLDLSTDIQTIELRIKKLKDLQKAIDNRKAIILSINLCSSEFTQSDSEESKKLQERLSQMNVRWDHVCSMIEEWRCSLQDALMQCQQIRRELLESQLKVASLQDMSRQLLVNAEGKDCLEAKEKVHVIGNRLKVLLKEVTRHIKDLEKILDISSSQLNPKRMMEIGHDSSLSAPTPSGGLDLKKSTRSGSGSSPSEAGPAWQHPSFFLRVLRAALPLQLLLLLLIGLACLVPMTKEDYSCAMANNFARSFHPMLKYVNGPPPL
ncbi:nesprin-1 isoform x1 [Limosa lapponica baueri]|uniref:Nesprin-1 isoform x1 n=1 Tax=Limosa lapponica baueri TaxID=1758121 RepID=A0A2I0U3B9_LIMLA|nr:nesprin-1 isoform x1 [Limosa lapponica baueri]